MTHVVNLLPWRDLRRRQRLRYTLLLAIGIVLLAGDDPAGGANGWSTARRPGEAPRDGRRAAARLA